MIIIFESLKTIILTGEKINFEDESYLLVIKH